MRCGTMIAAAVLTAWAAAGAQDVPAAAAADDGNLIWRDEFDGNCLDPAKWIYRQLGPRKDGVNVQQAVTLDGKGHLVITTSKVAGKYHTGMIATQGLHEWTGGYFECRVKLQSQVGHWSAFWLQSPRLGKVLGDTARSGAEIDIFEYLARIGDRIQHTLHWDGYGKDHKSAAFVHRQADLKEGWHTVGLDWTAKEYVFYVDGKETWRTSKALSGTGQYIILSTEVGKWAGDIAQARLPDSVYFDYVRVYKTRPAQAGTLKPVRAGQ